MVCKYSASSIVYRSEDDSGEAAAAAQSGTEFCVPTPPTLQPLEAVALAVNFEATIGRRPTEGELELLYKKIHEDRVGAAMGILACQRKINVGLSLDGKIGFNFNGQNAGDVLKLATAMTWHNAIRRGVDLVDDDVPVDRPMGTEGLPEGPIPTAEEEAAIAIMQRMWDRLRPRKTA